ncbi:ParB/RepB/Spo0J family partition protein [Microbacterium sp. M3]|uniref:ParB/RepB/Spo0J family partition protein n=1 Tax=Microbacterium arthrosphaerae TaxID=792652 RepID=A0ABU4GY81_9MICO|nr:MULTISPECIES: ParB/RepB/Spo0J family partition protein [Microbacterium]MDW4571409.1 ParB/RepB/Spo0J family partition protein [Microbacterium arthrosphaerae]MDW7605264.1 ParB/RepB/Spo0J family partition protein [Microbacterium sp. M3]
MENTANVQVASPNDIRPNPENPRLVFREKELLELESSIAANGILVPLTVYKASDGGLVILDGERRWRCSKKLGLHRVPIIVQPEPSRMQNLMMMFAIHNARTDWDPFPTALKLRDLEALYEKTEGRSPTEAQLAQLASLSRGEVRRLKNILNLPDRYLDIITAEQERPRSEQTLTVDHLLEVTRGAKALTKQHVISESRKTDLEVALIEKFRAGALTSTVEPRLLSRMARGVERGDVPASTVERSVDRLIADPTFTVRDAFAATVERAEQEHNLDLAAQRLQENVSSLLGAETMSEGVIRSLRSLRDLLDAVLGD